MPNIAGQYVRHSVEKDIQEFEGWPVLLERYERMKASEEWDVSQVYSGTFLTGGRINEVLFLKPEMFGQKTEIITLSDGRQIAREVLEVNKMPLEKHYRKLSHYIERLTESELPRNQRRRLFPSEPDKEGFYERKRFVTEKVWEVRKPFDIPLDEVPAKFSLLHQDFNAYRKERDSVDSSGWLFPSHTKRTHMTDSYIWAVFKKYGIYPHYLRGQRASCLISWNGLSMEQMMEWMSWEELKTAMHYGKMGKSKLLSVFRRFD
jgi:hypothetical protein